MQQRSSSLGWQLKYSGSYSFHKYNGSYSIAGCSAVHSYNDRQLRWFSAAILSSYFWLYRLIRLERSREFQDVCSCHLSISQCMFFLPPYSCICYITFTLGQELRVNYQRLITSPRHFYYQHNFISSFLQIYVFSNSNTLTFQAFNFI